MNRFVRSAWALAVAGATVAPAMATGQTANKPIVAVLYFDNNSFGKDAKDYEGLGKGVADMLITDLAANSSVVVVDRDRLQSVLKEQDLIKNKQIDDQTAVRLGKILGAQYMIAGSFISDGKGNLVLTSHSINVETSRVENPEKVQAKGDDVLGLIAQLSSKMAKEMKLPTMAPRRTGDAGTAPTGTVGAAQAPATTVAMKSESKEQAKMDLKTAMLYSKALEEQDNGNKPRAAELYRQVLAKFPEYSPAKQGLRKVSPTSGD
jgi:TolB-like protein